MAQVNGTFTATGATAPIGLGGDFTVALKDFGTATVTLERSFDDGASWFIVDTFTTDVNNNGVASGRSIGQNGQNIYRLNCTAYTSGTIAYYLGG